MIVFLLPLAFGLVQDHGAADQGKDGSQLLSALLPLLSAPADGFQVSPRRLPSRALPTTSSTSAGVLRASSMMAAEQKVSSEDYELQGAKAVSSEGYELPDGAEASPLLVEGPDARTPLAHFAKAAPMALAVNAVAAPAVAKEVEIFGINFDKVLGDFLLLFPLLFVGALGTFVAANQAVKYLELEDREDRMAEVMQFLPIAAAGAITVLIYTQPGLILFPLKTVSGFAMKTAFDAWNLVAPAIGLGGAVLRY